MSDELPSSPSDSSTDIAKSETIRITLPPKSEQPALKRETVRINVPNTAPAAGAPPSSLPPAPSRTFAPPSAPGSGLKAPSAPGLPPKPPTLGGGGKPTVPLRPAPAPSAGPTPAPQPAAAPKKETARISVSSENAKPSLPRATVKMQQTQPLVNRPAPISSSPVMTQALASAASAPENDSTLNILAISALVGSLVALAFAFLAFSGASPAL